MKEIEFSIAQTNDLKEKYCLKDDCDLEEVLQSALDDIFEPKKVPFRSVPSYRNMSGDKKTEILMEARALGYECPQDYLNSRFRG